MTTAPDGQWVASLYENICGRGFVTGISKDVEITRRGEAPPPVPDTAVVTAIDAGHDEAPMAIALTGPRSLLVTLPNLAEIWRRSTSYGDIAITYKFVPDDAVGRACGAELRSLPSYDKADFREGGSGAGSGSMPYRPAG